MQNSEWYGSHAHAGHARGTFRANGARGPRARPVGAIQREKHKHHTSIESSNPKNPHFLDYYFFNCSWDNLWAGWEQPRRKGVREEPQENRNVGLYGGGVRRNPLRLGYRYDYGIATGSTLLPRDYLLRLGLLATLHNQRIDCARVPRRINMPI